MSEHDFEPIRGLPGVPPPGESILWQGAPDWWRLAQEAFHVRLVAAYFAVMLIGRMIGSIADGQAPLAAVTAAVLVTPIALTALGILCFLAWLNSRTTVYTITSRRVVMRFGAALPKAINLPFTVIESASLKALPRDGGDLALALKAPNKIAFLQLWPHVRPWKVAAPEPTLRALSDARAVAGILANAMKSELPVALGRIDAPAREHGAGSPLPRPEAQAA